MGAFWAGLYVRSCYSLACLLDQCTEQALSNVHRPTCGNSGLAVQGSSLAHLASHARGNACIKLQSKAAHVCMSQGQKAATASAETLADELMAEEAQAAARAASKKVKKQKAKAKKQQARSENATAASSTAAAAADADVAEDPQASSVATAFAQLGLTHVSASPSSAASTAAEVAAMTKDEKAEDGVSVTEHQASPLDADDKFLQDLFRCPITKVSSISPATAAGLLIACVRCSYNLRCRL